ncbi:hypothetical protein ENASMM123B_22780 [Enterobacter asburiae]
MSPVESLVFFSFSISLLLHAKDRINPYCLES